MSSSLRDLLSEEANLRRRRTEKEPIATKPKSSRHSRSPSDPTASTVSSIPLCRDRRSVDLSDGRHRRSQSSGLLCTSSTKTNSSGSNSRSRVPVTHEEPETDDFTVHAVVSMLSGYAGRFLKEMSFRKRIREKCTACLSATKDTAHAALVNMEMGMENIERLAEDRSTSKDSKLRSLRNSVRLLSIVTSLNSPRSRHEYTCGVPNSHLSACAQLYLSIVYKIERSDRISARHLLQVFCDAPYLARKKLLPDLWEHFFLPHLVHLKDWYNNELEMVLGLDAEERNQSMRSLNRVYNDQMDLGTAQFALYYKERLKVGGKTPVMPSVSLPLRSSYRMTTTEKRSTTTTPCSTGRSILAVKGGHRRTPSRVKETSIQDLTPAMRKPYSLRLFTCHSDANRAVIRCGQVPKNRPCTISRETYTSAPLTDARGAITLISNSDSLSECEMAIRVVAKALLDSRGDSTIQTALSTTSVVKGLLEVSFSSKDDEVLELVISILAELVTKSDKNRQLVLNADPQLETLRRLLRTNSLFLKAAMLVYLLRPKAEQMPSMDWVPTVVRLLEYRDQIQTLFSVQCSPKSAALYLLDQLLVGFDLDRNVENAKQVAALGGLSLLIRIVEVGDVNERKNAISLLTTCARVAESCREYVAMHLKKACVQELLLGNKFKSNAHVIHLLVELLCLKRRSLVTNFLVELKNEGCLNTMHILLVYLQPVPAEQRPLVAAILLQLDLLGDPSEYSLYREEGIDAIIRAMDCMNNKKVQENCSKALMVLTGRFSSTGESSTEAWLLKKAGLDNFPANLNSNIQAVANDFTRPDEDENITEDWLRRLASVFLASGGRRFFVALSNCIANGISCLARSCLVTIAWMSCSLSLSENATTFWPSACSVLIPQLLETLKYDRALEERVLASLSLLNFARNSECISKLLPLNRDFEGSLRDLARFTWTANEILFLTASEPTYDRRI